LTAPLRRLSAGVLTAVCALRGQQAQPVVICVPVAAPARVGELLVEWYGAEIVVDAAAALSLAAPVAAEPGIWLLWDEWTLARAAGMGVRLLALPFRDELVFVAAPDTVGDAGTVLTWEAVAMAPSLHDRLGLVAPEVDGGPWLAALQQRLTRGEGVDAGIALWTTLDARAHRLYGSYDELARDLGAGRLGAGIGPRQPFASVLRVAGPRLQVQRLPGACARGIAIAAAAGARAQRIAAELRAPDRLRALAAAAGVTAADTSASLDPALANEWWQRFETHVRGRGRGVEQLADRLDLVFGIGFLVCAWFLYRALRRAPEPS